MSKIKLLQNIPVDPAHGLVKGKIIEVHEELPQKYERRAEPTISVKTEDGSIVNLYDREFERLKEES